MKKLINKQVFRFIQISPLILIFLLICGNIVFAADKEKLKKGDITTDGLTIIKSTSFTEKQIKNGVKWSEYTKYQITPGEVSFRKNWKRDYNRYQKSLSMKLTDKDMLRIKNTVEKIVYEELNEALKDDGGLIKVDEPDSNTLLFKPRVINLDLYAPEVQNAPVISRTYIRQVGRATLFLEVHDAVSGEILARWVDTREDPDKGYFEWANRITNAERVRNVIRSWTKRLVEGLDELKAIN